jgi:aspartate aminotransferase-like enzyme
MESYATEKEAIEAMKNEVLPISGLIGFYMDKCWNRIGTTGWDTLNELVSNVDQFKASMDRVLSKKEITQ